MTQESLPGRDHRAVRHRVPDGAPDVRGLARRPHVAVIGGGIAGLSAATVLAERGVRVHLLEREPYLGGRVGGWPTRLADGSDVTMTRGFHAFFRQYYNLRSLLRRTDPTLSALTPMADYPLVHGSGVQDSFTGIPRTPPWSALKFVQKSPTFSLRDLTRMNARAALPLLDVSVPGTYERLDGIDARTFLSDIRFPSAAEALAFEVFSRSFFADPSEFSAAELVAMFHIYFLGSSEGLLFDVPTDPFPQALWQPLERHLVGLGVDVRTAVPVQGITLGGPRRFVVDADGVELPVDSVVLACDVRGLQRIVESSPGLGGQQWREAIAGQRSAPAFVVSRFWLDRPVAAERPGFLGTSGFGPLDNVSVLDRYERESEEWARRRDGAVVELHAYAAGPLDELSSEESLRKVRDELLGELHRIYPETALAEIVDERHEVRADSPLFATGAFARRPRVRTPTAGLVLAGDLVRVDLPVALMERAATTGFHAANCLLAQWGVQGQEIWSVPTRGRTAPLRWLASALR